MKKVIPHKLSADEKKYLFYMLVLPPGYNGFAILLEMLSADRNKYSKNYYHKKPLIAPGKWFASIFKNSGDAHETSVFYKVLDKLLAKNILEKSVDQHTVVYSVKPEIKEKYFRIYTPVLKDYVDLIDFLIYKLRFNNGLTYEQIHPYLSPAEYISVQLTENDERLRLLNFYIASRYREAGNYQQSIKYALKEISICENSPYREESSLASSYYNVSITFKYAHQPRKALEFLLKAFKIREKECAANHAWITAACSNISRIFMEIGEYENALTYSLRELDIYEHSKSYKTIDIAHCYKNIALSYFHLQQYPKAKAFIDMSVSELNKEFPFNNIHVRGIKKIQEKITIAYTMVN